MTSDPDEIRDQIHDTQERLSSDVEALTDKVSPPRMVRRRAKHARTAITSVKDKLMGSGTGTAATATDAVGTRASAARDSVGSAAAGARDSVSSAASSAADAAGSAPQM